MTRNPLMNTLKYIFRACDIASVLAKKLCCAGSEAFTSCRTRSPFEGISDRSIVGLLDNVCVVPWSDVTGAWPFIIEERPELLTVDAEVIG
jgi:hypothetical protein